MQVICPMCNAEHKVASEKVTEKPVQAKCRRCGGKFVVEPNVGQNVTLDAKMVVEVAPSTPPASGASLTSSARRDLTGPESALYGEYPELQDLRSDRLNFEEIFSPDKKGDYKTRRNKYKVKILKAIHETLDEMLHDDEEVFRIGKATAYYPAEIFLGNGYLTMRYNFYAMACTSHRLLFINVNPKISKTTHYYFQIPFDGIKKVSVGLFGTSLVIHRHKSKRRVFTGIKRYMAKEFSHSVGERLRPAEAETPAQPMREDLCPSCFLPLAKNLLKCPKCKAAFKKPMTAFLRSLLLPGLGDIYLGHRLLGFLELLGSVVLWAVVIFSVWQGDQAGVIVALLILLFYNGFDGLLTRHMARKGYMLTSK